MTNERSIFDEESAMLDELAKADAGFDEDLPKHLRRLSDAQGNGLTSLHAQGHLIGEVARSLVNAGFQLHDCAGPAPTGGVCLTPCPAEAGVMITWTAHAVLALDEARWVECSLIYHLMNDAIAEVLAVQGWPVEPFGQANAHLITGPAPTTDGAAT